MNKPGATVRIPHWTILMVTFGAFLLPILGGHLSIEAGWLEPEESPLMAALDGSTAPFLTHFLLSLIFFIPLTYSLFAHRISQVVNLRITSFLAIFGACIGVSIVVSSFPANTILTILDWAMMSLAFFSVTLCCGRRHATFPVMGYIAGATLAAVMGIFEYSVARLEDPGYRIFAHQISPNQAGAMLAASAILTLTMSLRYQRVARLSLVLAGILMTFALVLTQSKGAILCLPIGLVVVLVGSLVLKTAKPGALVASFVLPLALTGGLAFAAQKAASKPGGASAITRVTNAGGEAAQSAGFRKLLWSSAISLTKQHPYGWGLGTYGFESTRPGLVTQTTLAHQTFLQLASEASPIAPLALFGFFGAVLVWGLRGIRSLGPETKILLVGVLGALSVSIAHNFVDSDMYIFGLGAFVFLLCGAFTSSSADSQAPEFIFTIPKVAFGVTALMLIPLCLSVGLAELYRSEARGFKMARNGPALVQAATSAASVTFGDGQALSLRAIGNPNEDDLVNATRFSPSPKAYRALADWFFRNGKYQESYQALNRALERDPNNAAALSRYIEVATKAGNDELAMEKARQLIATESSTYFTVRSQPEFIPTQTYFARIFLASHSNSEVDKARLLVDAVKGFASYRDTTVPVVMRSLKIEPNAMIAGEDKTTIIAALTAGKQACDELISLQRTGVALPAGFDPVAEAGAFAKVFESVNK